MRDAVGTGSPSALGAADVSPASPLFQPHEVLSLRDRAYDDIRDAILNGALNPGDRIKERVVAEQMGISTTPVKEALRRLEQEGLIVSQPHRGAVVGPLVSTPEPEILELRADLEGLAARLAAGKMTPPGKADLREQMHAAERANALAAESDGEVLVEATQRFHALIHEGAGNSFILRFLETLAPFDRTIRRRAILNPTEWQQDAAEHVAIVDAIDAGDGPEAERVMHEHIRRVVDR
jgi:DNA-binding GntR family transcriptional regulator